MTFAIIVIISTVMFSFQAESSNDEMVELLKHASALELVNDTIDFTFVGGQLVENLFPGLYIRFDNFYLSEFLNLSAMGMFQ